MIGTGTAVEVPIEYGKNFETENGSGETSPVAVRVTPSPESTQGPLTLLPQRPLPGFRSLLPGEASSGEEVRQQGPESGLIERFRPPTPSFRYQVQLL